MEEFGGWQFPAGEVHLIDWMRKVSDVKNGRHRYQGKKYDAALALCRQRRTAIDVGAHIGLFSYWMGKDFELVHAFEPVKAHRDCFEKNVGIPRHVQMHACALGETEGTVAMHTAPTSSGDSWVDGAGDIPMKTLDSFELENVDWIKLDCEGFELFALKGGEQTIKRWHPCIMVEQKPGRAVKFGLKETEAVDYLQSLGYALRKSISGDFFLTWGA